MGVITWNGVASNTLGIIVEKFPNYNGTKRRYESVTVAGRNGSLLFDLGGYENIVQEYEIALIDNGPKAARNIRKWLLTPIGYATLSDNYDSGYFRNAYFDGPIDIENVLNKAGRATIRFVCSPERYLTTGDSWDTLTKNTAYTYQNTYSGVALPLIECRNTSGNTVSGDIQILVDSYRGYAYTISVTNWSVGQWLRIDSLLRDCYNSVGPLNNIVSFSPSTASFIEIPPNEYVELKWTGGFTSVVFKPRWWTL